MDSNSIRKKAQKRGMKMDFYKFWKQFQMAADPEKLVSAIDEVKQRATTARNEARSAEQAYFSDVERKKNKIRSQIAELDTRRSKIESECDAYKHKLIEAMADEAYEVESDVRKHLESLAAEKDRIEDEVAMLQSVNVRGSDVLYKDVVEKNNRFLELSEVARKTMQIVANHDFVKRYEAVASCCHGWFYGDWFGKGANMESINKNYLAKEYAKKAAEERQRRVEDEERRQAHGLVRVTRNYTDPDAKAAPGFEPEPEEPSSFFARLRRGVSR